MRKTVAFFNGYYVPHLGGVERYTYNIANKLIEKGYRVIVVTTKHDDNLKSKETIDGVEIYRLPIRNLWKNRYPFLNRNKEYKNLISEIKDQNIDYYVSNTRFHIPAMLGARLANEAGKKAIVIEHGSSYLTMNNPVVDVVLRQIERSLISDVKKNTDVFYGVSKEASSWLKEFNIVSNGVLYNAVSKDDYNKFKDFRKNEDKLIISYSGRLQPKIKGIEILLSAFDKLVSEYPDRIELIIAGDGPLYSSLLKKYKNRNDVTLLGFVDHDKVLELDAKSDIFVLMSRSEGFSTAMLEAAMLKNVIITTPTVGGARDIMPDESYGFIIENNEIALYDTLKTLIEEPNQIKEIQGKVSSRVLKDFTWDQTADAFEKAFER